MINESHLGYLTIAKSQGNLEARQYICRQVLCELQAATHLSSGQWV